MKLSIIVPVYKVEEFLDACIESILSQKVNDCEIILVDDCSPDSCGIMCDEWAKKDKRIKVIHCQNNGGLSFARNQGLRIACGDYVTFVDSDDYLAPNTYKANLSILDENSDIDILEFPVYVYYGSKKEYKYIPNKGLFTYNEWIKDRGFKSCYVCNKIYRRELWNNMRFPEGRLFEDILTTPYIIEKSGKIYRSDVGMYYYCDRSGSISNTITKDVKTEYIKANLSLYEKLNQNKQIDISVVDDLYLYISNAQLVLLQLGGEMLILERKIPLTRSLFVRRPVVFYIKAIIMSLLGRKYCTFMARLRNLYRKM